MPPGAPPSAIIEIIPVGKVVPDVLFKGKSNISGGKIFVVAIVNYHKEISLYNWDIWVAFNSDGNKRNWLIVASNPYLEKLGLPYPPIQSYSDELPAGPAVNAPVTLATSSLFKYNLIVN